MRERFAGNLPLGTVSFVDYFLLTRIKGR